MSAADLFAAVDNLGASIAAEAPSAEAERTMSPPLAKAFSEAGLFRMSVPPKWGGTATELSDQLEVIERVAAYDGAAGWCVMIASTTSVLAGHLDEAVLDEVFGADPLASACGVYAPKGLATAVDGGYRVKGRWPFASGCLHSAWRVGGAMIGGSERPRMKLMMFRAEDTMVHDTWHVAGLRGTGSHDIEVDDVFVPDARAIDPGLGDPKQDGLLYRMPLFGFLAAEVAAAGLGIGRASIEAFKELATRKTPMGAKRSLADRGTVQVLVANAEANVRAGKALLLEAARDCEKKLSEGVRLGAEERLSLRLAANHAVRCSTEAVDSMYKAGGGTSLYERSPLQRHLRDIHTVTQHAMVNMSIDELCGRALLGRDVPPHLL